MRIGNHDVMFLTIEYRLLGGVLQSFVAALNNAIESLDKNEYFSCVNFS